MNAFLKAIRQNHKSPKRYKHINLQLQKKYVKSQERERMKCVPYSNKFGRNLTMIILSAMKRNIRKYGNILIQTH